MGKLEDLYKERKRIDAEIARLKHISYRTGTIGFCRKQNYIDEPLKYNIEVQDTDERRDRKDYWRTVCRCKTQREMIKCLYKHMEDTKNLIEYLQTNNLDEV